MVGLNISIYMVRDTTTAPNPKESDSDSRAREPDIEMVNRVLNNINLINRVIFPRQRVAINQLYSYFVDSIGTHGLSDYPNPEAIPQRFLDKLLG